MKKILLPLLIITCIAISCDKNVLTDTYWIAVKSYPIPPEKGSHIYDGMTVHFTKDKLIFGDVYDKRRGNYELKIDNKKIFRNDTLWAIIFSQFQDSLILDISENARVKFIKLDKKQSREEKSEVWEHKNWILTYNDYQRELFLSDFLFFDEKDSRLCIQKDLQDNQFISTIDKWRALAVNGNQLFVKTFHQSDNEFYRIKNYVGDSIIELESLQFPSVQTDLRKRQYISQSQRLEIFNQVQRHDWKTDRILSLDTLSRGSWDMDSTLIKYKSLKDKNISFKFSNDSTYYIYESGISMANGNWKVSQTGNEIVLNNGIYPSDYIDLISVNSDSLIIGNLRKFEPTGMYYGMNVEVYFKIKLKE